MPEAPDQNDEIMKRMEFKRKQDMQMLGELSDVISRHSDKVEERQRWWLDRLERSIDRMKQ